MKHDQLHIDQIKKILCSQYALFEGEVKAQWAVLDTAYAFSKALRLTKKEKEAFVDSVALTRRYRTPEGLNAGIPACGCD